MRWALLLLAGCGRIAFDPRADGASDGTALDGIVDDTPAFTGPRFVDAGSTFQSTSTTSLTVQVGAVRLTDTLLVAVGWNDASATVASIVDDGADFFTQVTVTQRGGAMSQVIFIAATPTATQVSTIMVTFSAPVVNSSIRAVLFENAQQVQTMTVPQASAGGTGTLASVSLVTDTPNSLVVAAASGSFDAFAGPGFTVVAATSGVRHLVEVQEALTPGAVDATATFGMSADWVIQAVALRPQ
jgi:hypothetical protein